jgi:Uri superfamily endonuclease
LSSAFAAGLEVPPRAAGTYLLLLQSGASGLCTVGRLGRIALDPGVYVYVGSALGPGGLATRLRHHARGSRRPHWHIDYLRVRLPLREIWIDAGGARLEHEWAAALARAAGAAAVRGFGCSDCGCGSHLFHFAEPPSPAALRRRLSAAGGAPRRLSGPLIAQWAGARASA